MPLPSGFVAAADGERVPLPSLGIEARILAPGTATGGRLAMLEETTAPGRGPPLHVHHRQTEVLRFLEGEYELVVGERRYRATRRCRRHRAARRAAHLPQCRRHARRGSCSF